MDIFITWMLFLKHASNVPAQGCISKLSLSLFNSYWMYKLTFEQLLTLAKSEAQEWISKVDKYWVHSFKYLAKCF